MEYPQHIALAEHYAVRDLDTLQKAIDLCPHKGWVVQAGGMIGTWAEFLALQFKYVVTFEPDSENYSYLKERVGKTVNVQTFPSALGYLRQCVEINCSRRDGSNKPLHKGLSHVVCGSENAGKTPLIRVDDLQFTKLDLLCLDLEGYELEALMGAVETIKRCRPVLLVEINKHCRHYGTTEEDVRRFITDNQYALIGRFHSDEIYVPLRNYA